MIVIVIICEKVILHKNHKAVKNMQPLRLEVRIDGRRKQRSLIAKSSEGKILLR